MKSQVFNHQDLVHRKLWLAIHKVEDALRHEKSLTANEQQDLKDVRNELKTLVSRRSSRRQDEFWVKRDAERAAAAIKETV